MAKYIKSPVPPRIIDAWRWDETLETFNKIGCKMASASGHEDRPNEMILLRIVTQEGTVHVRKGDYIIKIKDGAYHQCDRVIFEKDYSLIG